MGAKMNLAVVRGAQVIAVALMIGVAYSSTLGLLKPKKIDLHNHEQEQEVRPTPKVEHPNAWPPKPKTSVDPNMKVGPPSTQQLTKPKDVDTNELEPKQPKTAPGCSTPPGGGPPVTADFQPC